MRLCTALVAVLLFASSLARASDAALERARTSFQEGQRLYDLQRHSEALKKFEEAYLAKPDPAFLFNIAQCHRQLAHYGEAERFYRAFLRKEPATEITPLQREQTLRLIAEMERAQAEERAKTPPTGTFTPAPPIVVLSAPNNSTPPPDRQAPKPLYKKWWLWTIVGVAVVGVGVGVGVGVTQSGTNFPSASTAGGTVRW